MTQPTSAQTPPYVIIDFDSTFMQVEALEELADIVLADRPDRQEILDKISQITDLGVDGKIGFNESLRRRLSLIPAHRHHLEELVARLKERVSNSFVRNKEFFRKHHDRIYIISNGFREFIEPVVAHYHIEPDHVLANTFHFDESGKIVGFDNANLLAHSKGKSRSLHALGLDGEIAVIGDAYTDYEMKEAGIAHKFFAFTENVLRENILDKADHVTPSLDEFLFVNNMPMALSYPRNRIKVLLLEGVHPDAAQLFEEEGFKVETQTDAMTEDELAEKIEDVFVLGIRSKTQVTERVLSRANRLMAIGAFCIGTNQIDLPAAARRGVAVFNAPYSNTRSVVELALGQIIMLKRRIPELNAQMHRSKWNKSANGSHEVRGKRLGIVGYGKIGSQLSVLAEAIGMEVYYYDIVERLALGNARKCLTLRELLRKCDIISLHVDGRPENKGFFNDAVFAQMRPGSILLNLSRGAVVDLDALDAALDSGRVAGAAIDVYPEEPKSNDEPFHHPLAKRDNVILTPHIGGSTEEAQRDIGHYVPGRLTEYVNGGATFGSVNFPEIQLPALGECHRLIHIHENVPGILARINSTLAQHSINIEGQYLKTNEQIGYVITDIDRAYGDEVIADLKRIDHTIKFRVLY